MNSAVSRFALAAAAGLLFQSSAFAEKTLATVNGVAIPQTYADRIIAKAVAQGEKDSPALREDIRESLIDTELLVQAAKKQGLDKSEETRIKLEFAKQQVLVMGFLGDYMKKHPITDAELKKEYDAWIANMGTKEYLVRHILVDDESVAKDIIGKLNGGAKFDDLAAQSKDSSELGWSVPTTFVKPFAEALVVLEKGHYSAAPVKTQFGYHVIMLDDVRDMEVPPMDYLKPQLTRSLEQKIQQVMIQQLRAAAKIR